MSTLVDLPVPPSEDKRWRLIGATMRRHGYKGSSLIEILHAVQDAFGYLDDDSLSFVAGSLRLPLSRVFGVATFYHFFKLKPPGRHTCVICTGTACYIKGANRLIEGMRAAYGVSPGQTASDGSLSFLTARCVGSCGLAPVAVLDDQLAGNLDSDEFLKKVASLKDHVD